MKQFSTFKTKAYEESFSELNISTVCAAGYNLNFHFSLHNTVLIIISWDIFRENRENWYPDSDTRIVIPGLFIIFFFSIILKDQIEFEFSNFIQR